MINTREIAEEYRLSHWAQVMRERSQSGLSIKAFCQQAGMCTNTYFYWQRKLREAACTLNHELTAGNEENGLVPKGWTALHVEECTSPHGLTVEVGGCRIAVLADTDPELLVKVCRVLRTI